MRFIAVTIALAGFLTTTGVTRTLADEEEAFIRANMMFTVHHEIAHMLIAELQLPTVGREEEVADQYAWIQMLDAEPTDARDRALLYALQGWKHESQRARRTDDVVEPWSFYTTDLQRYFAGVCQVLGTDVDRFRDMAEQAGLPEEQTEPCAEEAHNIAWAWDILLSLDGEDGNGNLHLIVAPADRARADLREIVKTDRDIIAAVRDVNDRFALPADVALLFLDCGDEGAQWDPEIREISICYEELAKFREFHRRGLNNDD